MTDAILALNAGSSSIKFALFELRADDALDRVVSGKIEAISDAPHFSAIDAHGASLGERRWQQVPDHDALVGYLLDWTADHLGSDRLVAAGHRIVHGGRDFTAPARLTDAVIQALDALTPLAPLHQPHCLSPARAIARLRPTLPQVACFDTAFHHTMPSVATREALPLAFGEDGIRRYGFHGLSYEHIARALRRRDPDLAKGRVVVAHLGSGASLCALQDGRSVDTTMGFTPLDGLVMGTRCGSIDPGILLYLLQQKRLTPDALSELLYHRSGLLGLSGISSDMSVLQQSRKTAAREAIELFVFRAGREVAAMVASLGGLDGLVFTAGIGEHDAVIRAAICARLGWLGVATDADANTAGNENIAAGQGRIAVRVMATDEEAMIARHTIETLHAPHEPSNDT